MLLVLVVLKEMPLISVATAATAAAYSACDWATRRWNRNERVHIYWWAEWVTRRLLMIVAEIRMETASRWTRRISFASFYLNHFNSIKFAMDHEIRLRIKTTKRETKKRWASVPLSWSVAPVNLLKQVLILFHFDSYWPLCYWGRVKCMNSSDEQVIVTGGATGERYRWTATNSKAFECRKKNNQKPSTSMDLRQTVPNGSVVRLRHPRILISENNMFNLKFNYI